MNLESGIIATHVTQGTPLTLCFQLVSAGKAELDGLQFDVPDDVYISRYELSNYQLWYLCNVVGPERWSFEDWSLNRMERFAASGKLDKSHEAAMRAYCEQRDMPALCVNAVELQKLHSNSRRAWLLNLWVPSVGQWIRMASAGSGVRQNLEAQIRSKAMKWQGWQRDDGSPFNCLLPVRSSILVGADVGGWVDVFGGASEMVHVTSHEAMVLETVIDRFADQFRRSRWHYKGLFVPEHGFVAMGGSFDELGAGAASKEQAVNNFVEETTEWESILTHQLNGSMRWKIDKDWAVGLRLAMGRKSLSEAILARDQSGARVSRP